MSSLAGFNEATNVVDQILKLLHSELKVINVGIEMFRDALESQGVTVVHVSWQKPPKLEKEYDEILAKML
jgi:hypothetical protein